MVSEWTNWTNTPQAKESFADFSTDGRYIVYASDASGQPEIYLAPLEGGPTESRWHFGHTVIVSNVDDYTRAILIGRRRGPTCHDHGYYIATRESRHIVGDEILTLTDILRHREWPDVINLGAGQMDCHRRVASNWIRVGLLMPILPTEMPYSALLPRGLENILVGGKAFSGTHDVLYNLRNQPDMENLGGAIGVAAACAIRSRTMSRANVGTRWRRSASTTPRPIAPVPTTREIPRARPTGVSRTRVVLTGGNRLTQRALTSPHGRRAQSGTRLATRRRRQRDGGF